MNMEKLTIVVAGDLCMRAPMDALLGTDWEKSIFSEVKETLMKADIRVVNLENPLIDDGVPIHKSGPNLKGPESSVSLVTAAGFDAAIVANNHIGDFGGDGVLRTLKILDEHGIGHVGAGVDSQEARRPWITTQKGRTLAILAAAENEFGIAENDMPGANGLNLRRLCGDITEARKQADFVLVVIHGGNEYNPVPSPVVVDRYRTLADAGADAVIGMHPHCPQGFEIYRGRPIVYSTGNFLFGNSNVPDPRSSWYVGYLAGITLGGGDPELTVIPYRFSPDLRRISVLTGREKAGMTEYLDTLSAFLDDPEALRRHYESWCALQGPSMVGWLHYDPDADLTALPSLALRNLYTCEAHNDLMKTYLRLLCDGRIEASSQGIPAVQALQKMPV